MFAKTIIDSDAFLDMSLSAQALYFHLSMRADNKGTINNIEAICRMLKIEYPTIDVLMKNRLIARLTDNGHLIYTITDWETHNTNTQAEKERLSYRYQMWRKAVKERDLYQCQHCGSEKNLHAHHIKPFAVYKGARYEVSNGLTLCARCHINLHKKEADYK